MPEIETLGLLEEIGALVSDRLQVVSYKWLSRNFLVSSNAAKKLLKEFVEKHEDGLEVVYSVAGWLKRTPPTYHIRLVPGPKLAEAKQDFDDKCSIQVYSVQACIPKDPIAIWNAEFIQAEELFKQPLAIDNCLRDNRFCGVSNTFVKRNAEGAPLAAATPKTKVASNSGLATGGFADQIGSLVQPQQKKQQSSPNPALQSSKATVARAEAERCGSCDGQNKEASDKDKIPLPATKKKAQSDKSSTGAGGSLANIWSRAFTKSKSTNSSEENKNAVPKMHNSADAQISTRETLDAVSSDDEESDVNFKRASNGNSGNKRRVILDESDEEDYNNAVNLGSPDPAEGKSFQDLKAKQRDRISDMDRNTLNFDEEEECKPKVKEEKASDVEIKHSLKKENDSSGLDEGKNARIAASKEITGRTVSVDVSNKNKAADAPPSSPKRRKVLKTRIDDRGREVTEVVWEGEETETKDANCEKNNSDSVKSASGQTAKVEDNTSNPVNRAPIVKKSPAAGSAVPNAAGKGGNKKGANAKDPKQGNILSFFKRV